MLLSDEYMYIFKRHAYIWHYMDVFVSQIEFVTMKTGKDKSVNHSNGKNALPPTNPGITTFQSKLIYLRFYEINFTHRPNS